MADLKKVSDAPEKAPRGPGPKSGTAYPYFDLQDSIEVAKAIHEKGGGTCGRDMVAAALGYSTIKSGAFLSRIYAAKQFGLIQIQGDILSTTDRATQVLHPVMPNDAIAARAEAFLAVALFRKVYEKYKGRALPPEVGLKNLLKTEYKIVEDRIQPALRVMLASAEQAGFFMAGGKERMIAPSGAAQPETAKQDGTQKVSSEDVPPYCTKPATTGGWGHGPTRVHPALIAMPKKFPRPGTQWPQAKKDRFMTAFRGIVDVIYPDPEVQQ